MKGEIPAKIIYEDDVCMAFHDIQPQAPIHFLIVPRKEIRSLADLETGDEKILGHLLKTASTLAKQMKFDAEGFRTVINTNSNGGQSVYHLHVHVLAGRQMQWPPG